MGFGVLRFLVLGFRVSRFGVSGFRVLGFVVLEFRVVGFGVRVRVNMASVLPPPSDSLLGAIVRAHFYLNFQYHPAVNE